jgi:hypothetical protein
MWKILTSKSSYETMSVNYISEHVLLEWVGVCVCVCVCVCARARWCLLCTCAVTVSSSAVLQCVIFQRIKGLCCGTFIFRVELSKNRTAWHWGWRNYAASECRWHPFQGTAFCGTAVRTSYLTVLLPRWRNYQGSFIDLFSSGQQASVPRYCNPAGNFCFKLGSFS